MSLCRRLAFQLLLAFLWSSSVVTTVQAQTSDPSRPQLHGANFRITALQEGSFLEVNDNTDDGSLSFSGFLVDMLQAIARPDRANFSYELRTPSGYGSLCEPRLDPFNSSHAQQAHDKVYRTQYNCGASDVNDTPLQNHTTDMYLGLYYVTPARQMQNQFTIPYKPPTRGTLAMYGTATGIESFDDLVQQQQLGLQPAACAPAGTALIKFVEQSFPGLLVKGIYGADEEIDQAFADGTCQVYITDAPLVTQFVLKRSQQDKCIYNGMPVGLIGEPMEFGLSHYAIGIRRDIPAEVVNVISYWMNVLMSCNSLDPDGPCPDGNMADFYDGRGGTGSECGYVANPLPDTSLSPGSIAGIVVGVLIGALAVAVMTYTYIHRYKLRRQARRISFLETYQKRLGLLDKVAAVQRQYLEGGDSRIVYSCLLEGILELMDSEYGFIGEVNRDEDGTPYVHVHASSNQSSVAGFFRDDTYRCVHTDDDSDDDDAATMKFYNMDTLFGRVLTSKKPVVSNDPQFIVQGSELFVDTSTSNCTCGQQLPLQSFLGIPLTKKGGEIHGMIAIANKKGGYTASDVEFLEPFSATVTNLIQAFWQIAQNQHLINTLERKVQERTSKLEIANRELEEANRRVVQASAAQLKHFACMSHEIRTPLNCVIGLSGLLLETELMPSQKEEVRMIVSSGELLLTVVNDVLDYSKLESGNVDITIKECNLQETLNAVIHSIETKSMSKRLTVQTTFDYVLPKCIRTDGRRIQQVLYNLLGNAVKFSKEDGIIELSVTLGSRRINDAGRDIESGDDVRPSEQAPSLQQLRGISAGSDDVQRSGEYSRSGSPKPLTPGRFALPGAADGETKKSCSTMDAPITEPIVRFRVKDHGQGIHRKDFSKIFEPFSQVAETEQVYGGTGLGLAISSRLVHALGGTISVDSVEGEWSEFTVELPLRDDPPADIAALSRRLENAHLCFASEDLELSNHLAGIFETYCVGFSHHSSMDEIDEWAAAKSSRNNDNNKFHFCLVHEELFAKKPYERLKARNRWALLTYGPAFAVKETEGHFRRLVHMFPSVLIEKLGVHIEATSNQSAPFIHSPPVSANVPYTDMRFLIAEDNLINQKVLQRMLRRMGIENVTVVHNGREAVEWEAQNEVDCIFMDYQMPELSGISACRHILNRERGREVKPKIIFVTAHVSNMFENECMEAGGSGFLPKPCNCRDIEDCLQSLFS